MKILGRINIGFDIYQVSKIPDIGYIKSKGDITEDEEIVLRSKNGSYFFTDPLDVYEKVNGELQKTTYKVMCMNLLTWNMTLLKFSEKEREKMIDLVYDSILKFENGVEATQDGIDAVGFLKEECKLVGFAPSINYIMHKERGEGSLECFWEHPFSIPTLAFKHKKLPLVILSNGNIEFDKSKLIQIFKIHKNIEIEGIENVDEIEMPEDGNGYLG
jgi:hypothetical protein